MNKAGARATWDVLKEFGFEPDSSVVSEIMPGLSFDFGNFNLSASAVTNEYLKPVILFAGVLSTPRKLAEVLF